MKINGVEIEREMEKELTNYTCVHSKVSRSIYVFN